MRKACTNFMPRSAANTADGGGNDNQHPGGCTSCDDRTASMRTIRFSHEAATAMTSWAQQHDVSDLAGAPLLRAARDGARLIEMHTSPEARAAMDEFACFETDVLIIENLFAVRDLEPTINDRDPAPASRMYSLPLAAVSLRCGMLPAAVTNENNGVFDRHVVQKHGLKFEKRSDGGAELGPHTEHAFKGHGDCGRSSPAVDTLCLAGLRNPDAEPTGFALLDEVLPLIPRHSSEVLTRPIFGLGPPDSSTIKETIWERPILVRRRGRLEIAYRDDKLHIPILPEAHQAVAHLRFAIKQAGRSVALTPGVAWLANNARTLHWRDQVRNSDRWLVRTFGYAASTTVIVPDAARPELVEY